jgi:hypothetical protein
MNETHPPRRTGQSIGAVLAGIAGGVVLSLGTDSALRAAGIFQPLGQQQPMSDPLFLLGTLQQHPFNKVPSSAVSVLSVSLCLPAAGGACPP